MKLRRKLDNYVKESEQPAIVDKLIEVAKQGNRELIVNEEELEWSDTMYLTEEGLSVEHYNSEDRIKISWW